MTSRRVRVAIGRTFRGDRGFDVYDEAFDTQELDQSQRRASATTPAVVSWLKQRTDQPFFLWAHYFDAHYPCTPLPPFDRLYEPEYPGPVDGSIEFLCSISGVKCLPKRPTTPDDYRKLIGRYDGEIAFWTSTSGRSLKS